MDFLTYKPIISDTFEKVRRLSFDQKKELLFDDEKINTFLDTMLEFKNSLANKTNTINALIEKIEEITWFTNLDNDSLMLINDLISSIRDLYATLSRQYISLQFLLSKGIGKPEINDFKNAIDNLKDAANDLESTFFFLPNMPDFIETTKELSLV